MRSRLRVPRRRWSMMRPGVPGGADAEVGGGVGLEQGGGGGGVGVGGAGGEAGGAGPRGAGGGVDAAAQRGERRADAPAAVDGDGVAVRTGAEHDKAPVAF